MVNEPGREVGQCDGQTVGESVDVPEGITLCPKCVQRVKGQQVDGKGSEYRQAGPPQLAHPQDKRQPDGDRTLRRPSHANPGAAQLDRHSNGNEYQGDAPGKQGEVRQLPAAPESPVGQQAVERSQQ